MEYRGRIIMVIIMILLWTGFFLLFPNIPEPAGLDLSSSISSVELPSNALTSDEQLPHKVQEAMKNRVQILGEFKRRGRTINFASGTGYIFSDNIIISARHVLLANMINMQKALLLPFNVDRNGIPHGISYDYVYYSRTHGDSDELQPLNVIALGEWNTLQDIMAFDVKGFSDYDDPVFATTLKLGESIYVSGYSPYSNYIPRTNGTYQSIPVDLVEYTYTDYLSAIINDDNLHMNGLNMLLRLRGTVSKGFSGGVAFNKNGEIVGMAITMSDNFVYLISFIDIKLFLNKVKNRYK